MAAEPVLMSPGDVLFFHGQLIHGSYPNVTPDRFRRSLIAHYINSSAEKIADYYFPLLRMDGSQVRLVDNGPGGPCGRFVDRNGNPVVELTHAA
jgi:ectoine hydroxylase-related dioxygenase (phytanoyl-CoA dioxygenase family)